MLYSTEREGQLAFYEKYLKRINKKLSIDEILTDSTDGVLNGNILEFKTDITDVNAVLFQSIKYLSSMRVKGKSIPQNIVLISLNQGICYVYNSEDYLEDIEKIYTLASSKNNKGFVIRNDNVKKLDYLENFVDEEEMIRVLKENSFTKINIDENCIVGWGQRFYNENSKADKSDFLGDKTGEVKIIGEIRKPDKFKDFINPYKGKTNVKFQYLMDKLNSNLKKKKLGAFYTPELYVKKALELVREAIKNVPEENDYIILDRCAGTGNLEKLMTDEELSHCIVSTLEYYEYKVLMELLGDKVRHIVPPTEKEDTFNMGLVRGADALTKEYIENPVIKQYVDNPKCTIIMFENPPYNDTSSIRGEYDETGNKIKTLEKNNFVFLEMQKAKSDFKNSNISTLRDYSNRFIWSAFKYYLRQKYDAYIVFSPIKYYKSLGIIPDLKEKFYDGFIFNRKYFHATPAGISCIYWKFENKNYEDIFLKIYDIENNSCKYIKNIKISEVNSTLSSSNEKYIGKIKGNIVLNNKGIESNKKSETTIYIDEEVLGYFCPVSASFDIGRLPYFNGRGNYVTKSNYMKIIPLFATKKYPFYHWYEKEVIFKTFDNKYNYLENKKFLNACFFWFVLCSEVRIRSFIGSDNRLYKNELCLDGETIANDKLKEFYLNKEEQKMMSVWNEILKDAKKTANYNPEFTYGLYQIDEELNTKHKDEKNDNIPDYPQLNGNIKALKTLLKNYYLKEIAPVLFEYELLK